MVSIASPKGDGKRQITHEMSELREHERVAVR